MTQACSLVTVIPLALKQSRRRAWSTPIMDLRQFSIWFFGGFFSFFSSGEFETAPGTLSFSLYQHTLGYSVFKVLFDEWGQFLNIDFVVGSDVFFDGLER